MNEPIISKSMAELVTFIREKRQHNNSNIMKSQQKSELSRFSFQDFSQLGHDSMWNTKYLNDSILAGKENPTNKVAYTTGEHELKQQTGPP